MSLRQYYIYLLILLVWGCQAPQKYTRYEALQYKLAGPPTDSTIENTIAPYRRILEKDMNTVIGYSSEAMIKGIPESTLGNFIADLTLQKARLKSGIKVDFCLLNVGGLRTALPKGAITRKNIFELMPFENEIVVAELEADAIQELAEYILRVGGQPVSGIQIEASSHDGKKELLHIYIGGDLWDGKRGCYVATSDYLVNGGDQMNFFLKARRTITTGYKLRDAIIDHITELQANGKKIESRIDGRIKIQD